MNASALNQQYVEFVANRSQAICRRNLLNRHAADCRSTQDIRICDVKCRQ